MFSEFGQTSHCAMASATQSGVHVEMILNNNVRAKMTKTKRSEVAESKRTRIHSNLSLFSRLDNKIRLNT